MGPELFQRLLQERRGATSSSARERIDAEIRARWERPRAVLISDMSGFSRITQEEGILHFLGLIEHMNALCRPAIEAHGGRLVKAVADNLYASFPTASAAIHAGIEMHETCAAVSAGRAKNETVELGIGIAFGPILDLDGVDFFGNAVNLAAKLGEDIAKGGDLLVTATAAEGFAAPKRWAGTPHECRVSDVNIAYLAFRRT